MNTARQQEFYALGMLGMKLAIVLLDLATALILVRMRFAAQAPFWYLHF